jgi:hypothetical protein
VLPEPSICESSTERIPENRVSGAHQSTYTDFYYMGFGHVVKGQRGVTRCQEYGNPAV